MKPLSLFKRIAQHWKDHSSSPESDNDLSYDDALLDWKLRRFMQAEYGQAEPPHGIFGRVLAAIKAGGTSIASTRTSFGSLLGRLAIQFYNALAKPTATSRIVPGIVAFGLVVLVLTTNSNNIIFNTNYDSSNLNNQPGLTNSGQLMATELAEQEKREQATRRGSLPEGLSQFYPPANIEFYHPIERHLSTPKKHSTGNEQNINSEYLITPKNAGF